MNAPKHPKPLLRCRGGSSGVIGFEHIGLPSLASMQNVSRNCMFLMGSDLCIVVRVVCAAVEDSEEHYWSACLAPLLHQTGCVQHDSTFNFSLAAQEISIESLIQTLCCLLQTQNRHFARLSCFRYPLHSRQGPKGAHINNYDVRQSLHKTSTRAAANSIKAALSCLSASC